MKELLTTPSGSVVISDRRVHDCAAVRQSVMTVRTLRHVASSWRGCSRPLLLAYGPTGDAPPGSSRPNATTGKLRL